MKEEGVMVLVLVLMLMLVLVLVLVVVGVEGALSGLVRHCTLCKSSLTNEL